MQTASIPSIMKMEFGLILFNIIDIQIKDTYYSSLLVLSFTAEKETIPSM